MSNPTRAERLRALSRQARQQQQAPAPPPSLSDENNALRQQIQEAELEADNALLQAKNAETVKSAALHELEKYQLAFEQLQLRVVELESGQSEMGAAANNLNTKTNTTTASSFTTTTAAASTRRQGNIVYTTPSGVPLPSHTSTTHAAPPPPAASPSSTPAPPTSSTRILPTTPSAMALLVSRETIEKTPTLYLAGRRRRHGESMYSMGSKTTLKSNELNSSDYKNYVTRGSTLEFNGDVDSGATTVVTTRPRFINSGNFHDPRDPNHDYSQSKSPSRMGTLDRLHSKVSPTKHPITVSPQKGKVSK